MMEGVFKDTVCRARALNRARKRASARVGVQDDATAV
jgi:hypothetical protein